MCPSIKALSLSLSLSLSRALSLVLSCRFRFVCLSVCLYPFLSQTVHHSDPPSESGSNGKGGWVSTHRHRRSKAQTQTQTQTHAPDICISARPWSGAAASTSFALAAGGQAFLRALGVLTRATKLGQAPAPKNAAIAQAATSVTALRMKTQHQIMKRLLSIRDWPTCTRQTTWASRHT